MNFCTKSYSYRFYSNLLAIPQAESAHIFRNNRKIPATRPAIVN